MKKCLYLVLIAATLVSTVRFSYAETSPLTMVLPDARRPTHFVQISHYINTIRLLQSNIVMVTGPNEYDGISFWDIQSGQLIRTIPGGGEEVRVSSKEDRLLEVDSQSKPIHYRLRDMRTGRLIRKWTSIEYFQTATSSLSLVATSSFRKGIYLNDTATGHQQKPLTQSDSEIYFSVDDKYALLPGYNRPSYIVRMSDRRSWKLPKLYSMRMSRDGHRLFGMSPDGSLHIWDMGTFAHRTITTGLKRGYFAVELPDHSIAVTGLLAGQKDQFQVRSPDGKNLLRKFQGPLTSFHPVRFS